MRIALIGQTAFGADVLKGLIQQGQEVVGVFCPPDRGSKTDPLKEAALAAFNDPHGEFQVGELYIFAYDFSGKNLAHYDQSLVGKNLIDLKDPNGKPIIRDFVDIAKNGSGWLSYVWANPAHDNRPEAKIGYITRVDDDWLLGAGTYGPAAQQTPGASPSP